MTRPIVSGDRSSKTDAARRSSAPASSPSRRIDRLGATGPAPGADRRLPRAPRSQRSCPGPGQDHAKPPGALDMLPSLPLDSATPSKVAVASSAGSSQDAPARAHSGEFSRIPATLAGASDDELVTFDDTPDLRFSHEKASLAAVASEAELVGVIGFEPTTSTSRT